MNLSASMRQIVTRRFLLEGSLVVAASVAAGSGRAESELSEAEKIAHADAKYQPTSHGQQRCEISLQFEPPDHCKIVRSPISANGWCQYFAAGERTLNDVLSVKLRQMLAHIGFRRPR